MTGEEQVKFESLANLAVAVQPSLAHLEALKLRIKELPTPDLAQGYAKIKPFEKTIAEIVKVARDELIDVRFPKEKVEEDEKKHWYLAPLPTGEKLQARLSTKDEFLQDKAEIVLKERGLYAQATDVVTVVRDASEVRLAIVAALKVLENAEADGMDVSPQKEDLQEVLEAQFVETRVLNENKVKALYQLGQLDIEDIKGMFESKETRSLYIVKPKVEKPKKAKK